MLNQVLFCEQAVVLLHLAELIIPNHLSVTLVIDGGTLRQ